jgi:hypothetical protein
VQHAVIKRDLIDVQRLDYPERQFKQFLIHLYASNVVISSIMVLPQL